MELRQHPDYPDTIFIKGIERIDFKCQRCGGCCKYRGDIDLFPHDIPRIAKYLGMSCGDEFLEKYAIKEEIPEKPNLYKYVIKDKGDRVKTCIFYENNKCRIHPVKPPACFMFPFLDISDDDIEIQLLSCVLEALKSKKGKKPIEFLREIPQYEEEKTLRERENLLMYRLYVKPYSKFYEGMYSAICRKLYLGYSTEDGIKEVEERLKQAEEWATYII